MMINTHFGIVTFARVRATASCAKAWREVRQVDPGSRYAGAERLLVLDVEIARLC
jgi:hypothetical protein